MNITEKKVVAIEACSNAIEIVTEDDHEVIATIMDEVVGDEITDRERTIADHIVYLWNENTDAMNTIPEEEEIEDDEDDDEENNDKTKFKAESDKHPREVLETDICDWCRIKKATITDGTYVYCSDNCKKLFIDNAHKAIEEANTRRLGRRALWDRM